jgi:catecholate siderophore receptor
MKSKSPPQRSRALLPLGAIAAGFGLASHALAQTTPDPAAAPETVMPVVRAKASAEPAGKESYQATTTTIGKGKQELRDVPQSVTVVTERLIDDRNLDTLKDVLRNTAGISFLAAEGGEEDIRLRGFSLQGSGDIFLDAIRDPAYYERDSFNWDRVEVLRGSASMLFGRGSTGGAVNQVSKLPRLFQQNEVALTLGSDNYLRGTADLNLVTGETSAFRINAMANEGDNHGAKISKRGVAPTFRWGIGTADEFLVGLYYLDNNNGINYGMPWLEGKMIPVEPSAYYGMASDVNEGSATHGTFGYIHRFADRSELTTRLRAARYERNQRASTVRIAPAAMQPGGIAITQDNFGDDTVLRRANGNGVQAKVMDLETLSFQSDYDKKFNAFGWGHSLLAGIDLNQDDFTGYAAANPPSGPIIKPNTLVGTPNDGAWIDESLRIINKNRDFESTAIGIYAQDLVQFTPEWKAIVGLRWDRFEGKYRTYSTQEANFGELTAERERSDSLPSKRFGVMYQPTPLRSFHFSYGDSFNTSGDTYQYDALGSNTPPERSRNYELGAKLDTESGAATMRLALFYSEKYNERNRDEESVTPTNYLLSGKRHAAGLEIDISGRLARGWEIYGSYAWIPDAEIDVGASDGSTLLQGETVGERPGLTPRHSGTIWTTYQVTPKLRLGAGLNARSSDRPLQSTIVAPSFVTGDLMAEYNIGDVLFKLNVTNVTDELYADVLYRGHYIAGKPRTVQFTTAVTF